MMRIACPTLTGLHVRPLALLCTLIVLVGMIREELLDEEAHRPWREEACSDEAAAIARLMAEQAEMAVAA